MSDLDRMKQVQIGLHGALDFSTAPTFTSIDPVTAGVMPPDTTRIDHETYRADNQDSPSIIGPHSLPDIVLDIPARGVNGNAGGALNHLTATELGIPFDAALGAGTDPASTGTTVTADTGASALLTVTADTNCANGGGVMFQLTDGSYVAREQLSKATNVLTLDRPWTDGLGSDTTLYRSVHWAPDPSVQDLLHLGIRGKGQNWERTFLGCGIQKWSISGDDNTPIKFMSSWKPTDWDPSSVGPSFVAPTAGDYIMPLNCRLFFGPLSFMFSKWSLDGGYVVTPRETQTTRSGVRGYRVTKKSPVFKGMLKMGTGGATFGEITDASGNISLQKIQAIVDSLGSAGAGSAIAPGKLASTIDLAVQVGALPGSCMYIRMPAAELSGELTVDAGVEAISLTAKARRAATGLPMRIHLF